MADCKKYNGSTWEHSLRKLTTATDTLTTLPADIYADGNNATVGISGNTVQNGTPTPDNPIIPQGCGERTGNLCEIDGFISGATEQKLLQTVVLNAGTYTYSCMQNDTLSSNTRNCLMIRIGQAAYTYEMTQPNYHLSAGKHTMTFTVSYDNATVELRYWVNDFSNACSFDDFMLNTGSTPLPYEPYGYKIPISSASITTPAYLGEVETTRKIKKLVLTGEELWNVYQNTYYITVSGYYRLHDVGHHLSVCSHFPIKQEVTLPEMCYGLGGLIDEKEYTAWNGNIVFNPSPMILSLTDWKSYLAQQYAAGTPVTVWYVLATETTGIVNEPLMKIGDYADTVSGITIPTITGKDTFNVVTTLKPSEVELTYTGWHDATVKEKSRNLFDENATNVNNGYITNGFLQSDGSITTNIDYRTSEYIRIAQNQSYTLFYGSNLNLPSVCFYDSAKNYISGIAYASRWDVPFTTPQNAEYLRLSFGAVDRSSIMLNLGLTRLPYEPYWK